MRTVKEVSKLTGVSVRTLHYYDEIGLLKPSSCSEAGYRLYDDKAIETLQQILFYREFDMPLKKIKAIKENLDFDRKLADKKETDPSDFEIKAMIGEYDFISKQLYQMKDVSQLLLELAAVYGSDEKMKAALDQQYGSGAAEFIGKAIKEFYRK